MPLHERRFGDVNSVFVADVEIAGAEHAVRFSQVKDIDHTLGADQVVAAQYGIGDFWDLVAEDENPFGVCDTRGKPPDLSDRFDSWHGRPGVVAFEEFEALASAHGATRLGRGFDHVPATGWSAPERPAAVVDLDSSAPATIGLVGALLEDCPPADRDEAEFDLAALDPVLVGWVAGGRLTAVAGGRPEPARPGCHDIGVIVHPAGRRGGRGQAVVAAVTERLMAAGELPLYRYGATNAGSGRLCRAVGFEMVAELEAFEWPAPGGADG